MGNLQYADIKTNLTVNKMSRAIYKQLKGLGRINDDQLYVITDEDLDANEQTIKNVATPEISSDAANKQYVDSAISGKIVIDDRYAEKLELKHVSRDEYSEIIKTGALSNCLYVVSSETINAYGEQIKNVGEPELSSDAATKGYVDSELLKVDVRDQLTAYYDKSQVNALSTTFRSGLATTASLSAYQPKGNYLTSFTTALLGRQYDLSQNGMFTQLVVDIGTALGAIITNAPTGINVESNMIDGENTKFGMLV